MKADLEKWMIVVAGQWNPSIFSPAWIVKHLLDGEGEVKTQFEVAYTSSGHSYVRTCLPMFSLLPKRERLEFRPAGIGDNFLEQTESAALKTLELLPHTPVSGYGVNFHFHGDKYQCEDTLDLFNALDYADWLKRGAEPVERQIVRNLRISDSCVLNLRITSKKASDTLGIDLNYHHQIQVKDDVQLRAAEFREKAVEYRAKALEDLENVYGLTVDEEDDDD